MDNARERRLRRILRCQHISLEKSRRRALAAPDFGGYWILDRRSKREIAGDTLGMSLDEVEAWTRREAVRLTVENDKKTYESG